MNLFTIRSVCKQDISRVRVIKDKINRHHAPDIHADHHLSRRLPTLPVLRGKGVRVSVKVNLKDNVNKWTLVGEGLKCED